MSKEILMRQLRDLQGTDFTHCLLPGIALIMETSKRNAPVDTGNLRDSHEVEETPDSVTIKITAEYAGDIEFGTSNMEAQPYLRPAIDSEADKASELIAREVEKKIREVVK